MADNESGRSVMRDTRVPASLAGQRLDQALATLFSEFSRARLQRWIRDGAVLVDGQRRRPRDVVAGGESIELNAELEVEGDWQPQELPLDVAWRDQHLLIVDKPPGLVVHPGAGNRDRTMVNALLHLDPLLATVPRAGIVHRLDKQTSGLLVVARTLAAHAALVASLKRRDMHREYLALVHGRVTAGGSIDAPIGRHPSARVRMAVREGGRQALTHFRVAERFAHFTLLRVTLETGRTHQIRVHMSHADHPIVGDPLYGGRARPPPDAHPALLAGLAGFRRQALHAWRLGMPHPTTGESLSVERQPPDDMQQLLGLLRVHDTA